MLIKSENIFLEVKGKSKYEIIRNMINLSTIDDNLEEYAYEKVKEREELQPTSFGFPANNNELIVYFDSKQRDCLGEPNHSGVNTFKLNADNELLCELTLNDGTTQTVTLAKNIAALKFAYGIQDGTGTNPLAYQPYLDSSGAINTSVNSVWGTITSV